MSKKLKLLLLLIIMSLLQNNVLSDDNKLAFDFKFSDLDGASLNLSEYKG